MISIFNQRVFSFFFFWWFFFLVAARMSQKTRSVQLLRYSFCWFAPLRVSGDSSGSKTPRRIIFFYFFFCGQHVAIDVLLPLPYLIVIIRESMAKLRNLELSTLAGFGILRAVISSAFWRRRRFSAPSSPTTSPWQISHRLRTLSLTSLRLYLPAHQAPPPVPCLSLGRLS